MNAKLLIALLVFLALATICQAANEKAYSLSLRYSNGTVYADDFQVIEAIFIEPKIVQGDYTLAIWSFTGQKLYEQNFGFLLETHVEPPREWFDENGNQIYVPKPEELRSMRITFNESAIQLILPYFANAKEIVITNAKGEKILGIDVSQYSIKCGNNICDDGEDYFGCKQDCQSGGKDKYCDGAKDKKCDPDCAAISGLDADCVTVESGEVGSSATGTGFASNMRMFVILGGVIVTVAAAVVLFARLRNRWDETDSH